MIIKELKENSYFSSLIFLFFQIVSRKQPEGIQKEILNVIRENPNITRRELEELLDSSTGSIKHHLQQLVQKGIIKREGSDRSGKWVIL